MNNKVYIDTSGFYAYVCRDDAEHLPVREVLQRLAARRARLVTSSYALSETMGLIQKRMGFSTLSDFVSHVMPVVDIIWICDREHQASWQRGLTIVDATGIIVMRQEKINTCVALDPEFVNEGFRVLPSDQ
jgi:predicted nucleic acid-binding protein